MANPPMHPATIHAYVISVLEDWEVDDGVVPANRYADLAESLTESWLKDRRRAVLQCSEEIARAIEVSKGDRCPQCDGKPASNKWKGRTWTGRCGAGHTWEIRTKDWVGPAQVARDHAAAPANITPGL